MDLHLFLVLLLVIRQTLSQERTAKYKCADELSVDSCYFHDINSNTIFVKSCSEKEFCLMISPLLAVGQCAKKEMRQEGESCNSMVECMTGICLNGKCSTLNDGESCENDLNCGHKSFCHMKKCIPLYLKGESCIPRIDISDDNNEFHKIFSFCELGTLCGDIGEGNKCIELYSLPDGQISDNKYLCKSGKNHYDKELQKYVCVSKKRSTSTCDENNNCTITVYYNETSSIDESVNCWADNNSTYICPIQSDSQEWTDYLTLYQSELEKEKKIDTKISTMNRIHLGRDKLIKAAVNYFRNEQIITDTSNYKYKECLNDYWYRFYAAGNRANVKASLLLSVLLILLI